MHFPSPLRYFRVLILSRGRSDLVDIAVGSLEVLPGTPIISVLDVSYQADTVLYQFSPRSFDVVHLEAYDWG
jgi:hypothetical protein